jgi:hypothetical protein
MNATFSLSGTADEVKAIVDIIDREKRVQSERFRSNLIAGAFVLIKPGEPGYETAVYEVALFGRRSGL